MVKLHDTHGIIFDLAVLTPLVYLLDRLVARKYFTKSPWFALHTMINAIVVLTALPDFLLFFVQPMELITRDEIHSRIPFLMNFVVHIYHIVSYFNDLDWLDWLHHCVMTLIMSPIVFLVDPGPVLNFNHMFILGFPGMLDYAMLVMVKYQKIKSITEKRFNTILNIWIRCGGILFTCCISWLRLDYIRSKRGSIEIYEVCTTIVIMILLYWNGIYFMNRVTQNYAIRRYQERLKKDDNLHPSNSDQMIQFNNTEPEPMRAVPNNFFDESASLST